MRIPLPMHFPRALPQNSSTRCDFINKSVCFSSVLGFFFNFKTRIYWNDRGQKCHAV